MALSEAEELELLELEEEEANVAPVSAPSQDNFMSRVSRNFEERGEANKSLVQQALSGKQSKAESAVELVASGLGGYVGDVVGAAVEPTAKDLYANLRPSVQNVIKSAGEMYGKIPERGRNVIEAVGNIANVVPVAAGATVGVKGTLASRRAAKATPDLASADIKVMSQKAYKEAADHGGVLDEKWTNSFIDELQQHKPRPIGGKVLTSEQKKLMDSISEYEGLRDTRLSLEDIQNLDETLGDKVTMNPLTGKPDKAGYKVLEIQDKLREMVLNAPESNVLGQKAGFESLDKARKLWSAHRAMDDIERIIERAGMMDNEATSMKAGFRTLAMNRSRMKGYTPQEQALIKKAAKGQPIADLLRTTVGSRLISTVSGYAGGGLGGAAAGAAVGMAARGGASALQLRKAQKIMNEIGQRATKAGKE